MPLIIEEGYTNSLRKRLRRGKLDVAIICLPFEEPDVVVQPLFEERFIVVLPSSHRLAKSSVISPEDLEQEHTLLLGEDHCFRDQVINSIPNINQHFNTEADGPKRTTAIAWRAGFPRYKAIEAVRNAIYASYNLSYDYKILPKLANDNS